MSRSGVTAWPSEFPGKSRYNGASRKDRPLRSSRGRPAGTLRKKAYDLTGMLAAVEPGNLHPEIDAGPGTGKGGEGW